MPSYIAANVDITKARQGRYFERTFLVNVNFTSMSAKAYVCKPGQPTPTLLEFQSSNNTVVITADSITIKCSAVQMTLPPGVYRYYLDVFTTVDDVQTIMEGQFEVI